MSIGELADAAGLSRRAIRFYVQQGLLPAPTGRGRGSHYDGTHLQALHRIAELQAAGHSLDAIRVILKGGEPLKPIAPAGPGRNGQAKPRPALSAELWTRLRLAEGLELHFDATRFNPDVGQLLALRDAVRAIFVGATPASPDAEGDETGRA